MKETNKPRFNIKDYPGDYAMLCNSKEESDIFRSYLHNVGKTWCSGDSYLEEDYYDIRKGDAFYGIAYHFNRDAYTLVSDSIDGDSTVISFDDFDWSEERPFINLVVVSVPHQGNYTYKTDRPITKGDVVKVENKISGSFEYGQAITNSIELTKEVYDFFVISHDNRKVRSSVVEVYKEK